MMTKNRVWVWALLVLIVINVTALITIGANTWVFKKGKSPMMERSARSDRLPMGGFVKNLDLSEDQSKAFEKIQMTTRQEMRKSFEKMKKLREELNVEFAKELLDLAEIEKINQQITEIDRAIRQQGTHMQKKLREILNEEQVKIFIKEMKTRRSQIRSRGSSMGIMTE